MNEFLEQFVIESHELVEQATADLLALEKTPDDAARLDSAFRAFHTLKGGAGIVDFTAMAQAVHAVEDELAGARAGKRNTTVALVSDCLRCLDRVVQWLELIERTGELPQSQDASPPPAAPAMGSASRHALDAPARGILEAQLALLREAAPQGWQGRVASAGRVSANALSSAGRADAAASLLRVTDAALAEGNTRGLREAVEALLRHDAPAYVPAPAPAPEAEHHARTLRVDTARIDALVALTGELTVAANSIGHAVGLVEKQAPEPGAVLKARIAVLHRLTGELQRSVLGMRVLPLDHVFQRFPRVLREMAAELGKPAGLVIEGGDTEADKVIVESLFEPLVHVIRNAIGHGIEDAATRAALRKPAAATIRLAAWRQGEHVVVEVSDDGQGIDVARVRALALERGVLAAPAIAAMSDEDVVDIIFEPGFSTATQVTGLSGRGVGMDAVRTAVGRLAGQVGVDSRAGLGTTVRFLLPFSVMMTPIIVVGVGAQAFGIPLDAVVETLRIPAQRISAIGDAHVVVIRDRTLALLSLGQALAVRQEDPHEAEATIVVTRVDGRDGALRVDRVGERMEVMMKPLEGLLARMPALAGSTLLGDGSVLLILDPGALFD